MFDQLPASLSVQMGPTAIDALGDGFVERHALSLPLYDVRFFSAGASGTSGDDDDDDDDEQLDRPAPTGNAAADAILNREFNRIDSYKRKQDRKNRKLRSEKNEAVNALEAIKRDSVILTGDDKKAYEEFAALGLKPSEISAKLNEHGTLTQTVAQMQRDTTLRDVASTAGASFDVLRDKAGDLDFEIVEVEADGKKSKVVNVKPKDGQPVALRDYAAQQWAAYVPALFPAQTGQQNGTGTTGSTFTTRIPAQPSGNTGAPKSALEAHLEAVNAAAAAKPSPFAKPVIGQQQQQ